MPIFNPVLVSKGKKTNVSEPLDPVEVYNNTRPATSLDTSPAPAITGIVDTSGDFYLAVPDDSVQDSMKLTLEAEDGSTETWKIRVVGTADEIITDTDSQFLYVSKNEIYNQYAKGGLAYALKYALNKGATAASDPNYQYNISPKVSDGNLTITIKPVRRTPKPPVFTSVSTELFKPVGWLPMPEPADNEMYLLFHIPDGASSLLAFTVTCTGNYIVEPGTVSNGAFSAGSSVSIASGSKYEAELFADDYGDLTSTGMKQVMVKISGTDILTWAPSAHSKKTSPANFAGWNIVEIACKLPKGTKVACGNGIVTLALKNLKYFSWYGENEAMDMSSMFRNCYALTTIPQLDTSAVTDMSYMFNNCYVLTTIPQLNTSAVTDMSYMFNNCYVLTTIPQLDTSAVTSMTYMFSGCCSLTVIPLLDTSVVTSMRSMFSSCYSLTSVLFNPFVANWTGYGIDLSDCSLGHTAITNLFNSLPTITTSWNLTLTGNPGVSELTDTEKAIATGKNWMLTL